MPRRDIPRGDSPSGLNLEQLRSMECAIFDLIRKLTSLPVGDPRRRGLIEMIRTLSDEMLAREQNSRPKTPPGCARVIHPDFSADP